MERARRLGREPIDVALDWYRPKASVHYTVDYDGTIFQMMPDDWRGAHVGISRKERKAYLSGTWEEELPPGIINQWMARWYWPILHGFKSPQNLYPGRSPNGFYVAIEMVPLLEPTKENLWFTDAQHEAVADLAMDLARRHNWPPLWALSPRLLGHEDLDAYARWDKRHGGWDPGALRKRPRFSWEKVLARISGEWNA